MTRIIGNTAWGGEGGGGSGSLMEKLSLRDIKSYVTRNLLDSESGDMDHI